MNYSQLPQRAGKLNFVSVDLIKWSQFTFAILGFIIICGLIYNNQIIHARISINNIWVYEISFYGLWIKLANKLTET